MIKRLVAAAAIASLLLSPAVLARGHSSSSGRSESSHSRAASPKAYHAPREHQHSKAAVGVPRDAKGRIKRDPKAKSEFKHTHPCPATGKSGGKCQGFVIDHVNPLKRGGADAPFNMQWQSVEAAKAKDRIE